MDLIHADANFVEIGYITEMDKYDAEISQELNAAIENNSFALVISDDAWNKSPIHEGHYIYIPGTEWGGEVELVRHSTASGQVTLSGVTWRGMIFRKVIEPPAGQNYKRITNTEANQAIASIIGTSLGFVVSDADSGITIVSRDFRYTNMLTGIEKMLTDNGAALDIVFDQPTKSVVLSARAILDYSERIDLSQDYGVDMITTLGGYDRYNHIIALGAGELEDRDILHVYRLDDGTITTVAPDWVDTVKDQARTYDYNNPENVEELLKGATELLTGYAPLRTVEMDPNVSGLTLNLGDKVAARDRLIGMQGIVTVIGKILIMDSTGIRVETRVG